MRNPLLTFFLVAGVALGIRPAFAVAAGSVIELGVRDDTEFRPGRGEEIAIPVRLHEPGEVTIELYSGDGDPVRTLEARRLEPGTHEWTWDGRDAAGNPVPDAAWHPVVRCACDSGPVVLDPREETGGVPLGDLDVRLAPDGTITYRLPEPARVLVRVGIEGGAMVRGLDTWSAHAAGLVRQSWDGMGAGGTDRVLDHEDLTVLVRAFTLPDHAIVTSGNDELDYQAYRERRDWPKPEFDPDAVAFQRDGQRLAREAGLPASMLRDPAASIEIVDGVDGSTRGLPVVPGAATFRVNMPKADRWLMQQSLYEVGFFLDYRFISEEETGYTPLSWRWGGNAEPGVHTMTVNLSGLWGQVGVATVKFVVPEGTAEQ